MSSCQQIATPDAPVVTSTGQPWFAIQTRPRHEKRAAEELRQRGIATFLPLLSEVHSWSDRRKVVQVPLFSCYAFVSIDPVASNRVAVLQVPGVLGFVGSNNHLSPVTYSEIQSIRAVLSGAEITPYPFLRVGQRARILDGALAGVEGILVARDRERGLVLSVNAIERSVYVRIEGYKVEPL